MVAVGGNTGWNTRWWGRDGGESVGRLGCGEGNWEREEGVEE